MAKLVDVLKDEDTFQVRQLPLVVDEQLTMILQINDDCFGCDHGCDHGSLKRSDYQLFLQRINLLTREEVTRALRVPAKEVFTLLAQSVPCVGCRRSVERLFHDLAENGYPALEPLSIVDGDITVVPYLISSPRQLCQLFHAHAPKLSAIVKALPKSKKNQRCVLHSLDVQRSRPIGNWMDVWSAMADSCRDAVVILDTELLLETLEAYLRKHRFCVECRTKVLRAYSILVGEVDGEKEKGYQRDLYKNITRCNSRDIHLPPDAEYIKTLFNRAAPELLGNNDVARRDRHAKTIEIAQEEVLTCVGICLFERLHRIQQRRCEEELSWDILFCVGVDALKKNFQLALEEKQGISQLELLCQEISQQEEKSKERKEKQKMKKKIRKQRERENKENEQQLQQQQQGEKEECCCGGGGKEQGVGSSTPSLVAGAVENSGSGKEGEDSTCDGGGGQESDDGGDREGRVTPSEGDQQSKTKKKKNKKKREKKAAKNASVSWTPSPSLSPRHSPLKDISPTCPATMARSGLTNGSSAQDNPTFPFPASSADCGYSSGANNESGGSCEGSDIACSDSFCNHDGGPVAEWGDSCKHHEPHHTCEKTQHTCEKIQHTCEKTRSSPGGGKGAGAKEGGGCQLNSTRRSYLEGGGPGDRCNGGGGGSKKKSSSGQGKLACPCSSLVEMLKAEERDEDPVEGDTPLISELEIEEFQQHKNQINRQRMELRENLRQKFQKLCTSTNLSAPTGKA
ncbi:unnamed protein product [Cyprideis torosa]|uniref:Uncharacterized protein n=1 Tax=Cyprideis torosa TaxID=163714 RepID=A0A7R8W7C1_9CRUS|nr:unnamed protein product [Cyprideis torosa]CAG0886143.1 unnamed protein product [Cyprideis torosa]